MGQYSKIALRVLFFKRWLRTALTVYLQSSPHVVKYDANAARLLALLQYYVLDGVLLSGWLNVCLGGEIASGGFVCIMRAERDMLLVSSEAFSESMMSER